MAKQRASLPREAAKPRRNAPPPSPTKRLLPWIGGAALLIAAVVGIFLLMQSNTADAGVPGVRYAIQGQQHIEDGQTHPAYNSDPPTSGWHYPRDLPAGFYETGYPDELLVHNLEHGHIVISYDCSKLVDCEGVKTQLKQLLQAYSSWKVTIVPRANQDAAIALTAWGWLETLDGFDEARMRRFIDAWRHRGPEATMY